MKHDYFRAGFIVAIVAIFCTNLPLYLYENRGWVVLEAPKHWVILACVAALPILLRDKKVWDALSSPIVIWCMGYACVTVFWFFVSSQSEMAWQEVRTRFFTILQIAMFLLVLWDRDATRIARAALVGTVLFTVALNLYEVFYPMTFSTVIGRSAALFMNPNLAGEALVLGMILSVTVLPRPYQGPYMLLVGVGIAATMSRASIMGWVLAVAGLLLTRAVPSRAVVASGAVTVVLATLLLLPKLDALLTTWQQTGVLNVNVMERLEWFTDPSGVSDRSSSERRYVAQVAWDTIAERPLLGSGTGYYHNAPVLPHNQYLSFMLDHGLVGATILPFLILAAIWNVQGHMKYVLIVFACVMTLLSFFTHAILNVPNNLLLVALCAAMSGMSRREHQPSLGRTSPSARVTGHSLAHA